MRLKKNIALSESGFVFDPSTGDSYTLNDQAKEIVQLLKEGLELEAITAHMLEKYEIDKVSFEKYFFDFAGMLKQYRLIDEDE